MANIKIAQLTNQTTISDTDLVIVETATSTNKMTAGKLREGLLNTATTLWTGAAAVNDSIVLSEKGTNFTLLEVIVSDSTNSSSLRGSFLYPMGGTKYFPVMYGTVQTYVRIGLSSADEITLTLLASGNPDLRIVAVNGLVRRV